MCYLLMICINFVNETNGMKKMNSKGIITIR